MSNLSILDHNIIHSFDAFADPDGAERLYLAKRDRVGPLSAEQFANCWGRVSDRVVPMIAFAESLHGGRRADGLLDFFRTRYLNMEAA